MRAAVAALTAITAMGLAACANTTYDRSGGPNVPPTPTSAEPDLQPGERPARSTDEAGLWMRVENAEASLRTGGDIVRDSELNAYVRDVACRVAGPYCPDIRVYIVRHPEFNASMAPNGMMLVHTGLLVRARNEAQLATVLGHEIGHYIRRHGVQRMRDLRDISGFAAVFGLAPYGVGLVVQLAALGSAFAFSRDNEREADSIGLRLIDQAGYDPTESPKIWAYMIKEDKARPDPSERSAFFATHPPREEREETLVARAKAALGANPARRTTNVDRYRDILLPRRSEYIRDLLRIAQYERAMVLIETLIEDGANPGELRYLKAEALRLRDKKDDRTKAVAAYREALADPDCPPEASRGLGQVLLAAGDKPGAEVAFRAYLDAKPNAPDREMVQMLTR
jgi:predicted Zn-dependent protease